MSKLPGPLLKSLRGSRGMPRMSRMAWNQTVVRKNL